MIVMQKIAIYFNDSYKFYAYSINEQRQESKLFNCILEAEGAIFSVLLLWRYLIN